MHVPVDQARHQKPSSKVHRHRRRADKGRHSLIAAYVDNPSVANRQRLGGSILRVCRENDAVAIDAVGGARGR